MSNTTDPNLQPSVTISGGPTFPSADPNKNVDPFNSQPSIYLYGFLATLVLIFLVSIGVAWKGFHTRRMLRRRIDDAIARGVLIPGYDPSNPNLPIWNATTWNSRLRNAPAPPRPIMYEGWIGAPRPVGVGEKEWDIKPAAVTALRTYDPTPDVSSTPAASHPHSLFNQLLDPLRQYWFVTAPSGTDANQLQGRPARPGRDGGSSSHPWALTEAEEEEKRRKEAEEREKDGGLKDVDEVVASVLIAMPDKRRQVGGSLPNSSYQPAGMPVASASRPTSSSSAYLQVRPLAVATSGAAEEEHKEELPELVLGVVQVGVALPEEMRKERERKEQGRTADVAAEGDGKGKAVEGVPVVTAMAPEERR